jgi:hypothetical protein
MARLALLSTSDKTGLIEFAQILVKEFEFDYDEEFINEVIERVKLCRDYIQSLINEIESKP